jgi:hypothetical protein
VRFYPEAQPVKRTLGTLTVVGLGFFAPLHAEASGASCRVPGGHAVATGKIAKLIAVPTPSGSALLACIRRSGRKIALDDSYTDARVAGRWAAWQRAGRPGHWRIAVQDLRTGKSRLVNGHVAAHSLGLTAAGTVVWAQEQDSGGATPLYANELGRDGRLLDDGAVDARSVRLAGRRVSWRSGGQRRAATVR